MSKPSAVCPTCDRRHKDCGHYGDSVAVRRQTQESIAVLTAEALAELEASQWPDRCGCDWVNCPWDRAGVEVPR